VRAKWIGVLLPGFLSVLAFGLVAALAPAPSRAYVTGTPPCSRDTIYLENDIDTARARAGDPFVFRTFEAATAPGGFEVPANTVGYGVVAISHHADRGGRGGYVVLETRFILLANGDHLGVTIDWAAAQRATATGSSQNAPGFLGAIPFVGYVLGPYGFLHHGKDVTIPRGARLPVILGDDQPTGGCRVVPLATTQPKGAPSESPQPGAFPSPTPSPSPAATSVPAAAASPVASPRR
jgi:hypothetical protein